MADILGNWGWLIFAGILLALETLAPGIFLIWFAVAALIVGLADIFFDLPWQAEVIMFAVLALVSTFVGRRFFRGRDNPENELLHSRGRSLIGKRYILPAPIENGSGYVLIGDSRWRVVGPDLPKGTEVEVLALSGAALEVAAVPQTAP